MISLRRSMSKVLSAVIWLELAVLAGALLWTLRPDGDIGHCDDVCPGDRSVEAFFGGGYLMILILLAAAVALVCMVVAASAWRLIARRSAPGWLPWASAVLPVSALLLAGIWVIFAPSWL
jgi:hypothetical protein